MDRSLIQRASNMKFSSIFPLFSVVASITRTTSGCGVSSGETTFDQVSNRPSLCQSQPGATRDQTLLPNRILMTTLTQPSLVLSINTYNLFSSYSKTPFMTHDVIAPTSTFILFFYGNNGLQLNSCQRHIQVSVSEIQPDVLVEKIWKFNYQ